MPSGIPTWRHGREPSGCLAFLLLLVIVVVFVLFVVFALVFVLLVFRIIDFSGFEDRLGQRYPGKNWVVSVSVDKTLKVWDVGRGWELLSLVTFTDCEYLAYNPLGCYAGSTGAEAHFKVFSEGALRDITADTRKALLVTGGVAPLLAAMER